MSGPDTDLRLEREVREALRGRAGGPAPYALRSRVDRIPDEVPVGAGRRPTGGQVGSWLAAVAAVVAVAIGLSSGAAHGPASGALPSPGSSPLPVASFDPALTGPGVLVAPDADPMPWVVAGIVLLLMAAVWAGRWWRVACLAGGLSLAVYAGVASQLPVTIDIGGGGFSPGLSTLMAERAPASDEDIIWEVAAPGEPFVIGTWLDGSSAVPVTFEGIIEPWTAPGDPTPGAPTWRAIWIDKWGDEGGMEVPGERFRPLPIAPREIWAIWLVGRAGTCSLGSSFDPADAAASGYAILERVKVQVRVLGWPRTVDVPLGFRVAEPQPDTCSAG